MRHSVTGTGWKSRLTEKVLQSVKQCGIAVFLTMVVWMAGSAYAAAGVYINPAYEDMVLTVEEKVSPEHLNSAEPKAEVFYDTFAAAGEVLLKGMLEREPFITVGFRSEGETADYIMPIFQEAVSHTGNASAGDYLRYTLGGFYYDKSTEIADTTYYYTIVYEPIYYTTKAQEEEMDAAVAEVLQDIPPAEEGELEACMAIYDYICSHVVYDHEHLEDDTYSYKHTAHAALIEGTAVCQGYATLFYRLALEAGLDARVITGYGDLERHAWNIVRIGDLYYNLDATWDAEIGSYTYFLKSTAGFPAHTRSAEMDTDEYHAQYPMSKADYVLPVVQGACGENVYWELDTKTGTLTFSGNGPMSDFGYIDSTNQKFYYLKVKPWNEYNTVIRKIVFEKGVTSAGAGAFVNEKSLTEIVFHNESVVDIGIQAFSGCEIQTDLVLPDSLRNIADHAFQAMTLQGGISFGEGVEVLGKSSFSQVSGITEDLIFPDSLLRIGDNAFASTFLNVGIHLGNSLKYVGKGAFAICGLTGELYLPESLQYIGENAFASNKFTGDLVIPDSVTTVGIDAFGSNCFTGDLIIGNGITEIPMLMVTPDQFSGRLEIGESITELNAKVFYEFKFTGDLVIPDSVKSIGEKAFYYGGFDGTLTLGNGLESIDTHAFYGCKFKGGLVIPDSVKTIEASAFWQTTFDGPLVLGNQLETIGESAFWGCGFTGDLVIPDSVTTVGAAAFNKNRFTGSLIIGNGVTEWKENMVSKDSFSGNLVIGTGITELPRAVFSGFQFTGDLVIPDSVKSIGYKAFYECGFDGELTLGSGVTSIEDWAFYKCGFSGTLLLPDSLETIGDSAFYENMFSGKLTVPASVQTIGGGAFFGLRNLEQLVLDMPCTSFPNSFGQCTSLREIYLPETLEKIDVSILRVCTALEAVYFSGNAPSSIVWDAFPKVDEADPSDLIFYYPLGKTGWTTPMWNGYQTIPLTSALPEDTPQISLRSRWNADGGMLYVTAFIEGNPGISDAVLELYYNHYNYKTGYTLVDVEYGEAFSSLQVKEAVNLKANPVVLSWEGTENAVSDGELVTLVFSAPQNAMTYEYPFFLSYKSGDIRNEAGEAVDVRLQQILVKWQPAVNGDANGDGSINETDAALLKQYFTGRTALLPEINLTAADVDKDGKLTRRDAMILSRYIAAWPGYASYFS